ncbi:hypothetical protein RJ641_005657 [Dillenia turbinata]|uniref:Uncharacterized protein n=1 Tax=Dillenia turbinata TaxID=194707 RepID=A0AAN8VHE8_9MAGN
MAIEMGLVEISATGLQWCLPICQKPTSITKRSRTSSGFYFTPKPTKLLILEPKKATFRTNCIASLDEHEHSDYLFENQNLSPFSSSKFEILEPLLLGIKPDPPNWPEREELFRSNIERIASNLEIPVSLRIIKKKQQWQESLREAKELTYSSVNKAFNSMVFMVRELQIQSFTLHMKDGLSCGDIDGVVNRVQRELNTSFVWLFQQVFAKTPTLMVYLMILLANFTVYSMTDKANLALASTPSSETESSVLETEVASTSESSRIKTFIISARESNFGGVGKRVYPTATGSESGDRHVSRLSPSIIGYSSSVLDDAAKGLEIEGRDLLMEEEMCLWGSMVTEAERLQWGSEVEAVDQDVIQGLVSPVSVQVEAEDYESYYRTGFGYQLGLWSEPSNPLLLCNYAQFLYLVAHDHDRIRVECESFSLIHTTRIAFGPNVTRAEECFRRAVALEPPEAEALSQYAKFLWTIRKDIWGAEERYQQAMMAEPDNHYHAANYANFLWNTGGEDTCYPLKWS